MTMDLNLKALYNIEEFVDRMKAEGNDPSLVGSDFNDGYNAAVRRMKNYVEGTMYELAETQLAAIEK